MPETAYPRFSYADYENSLRARYYNDQRLMSRSMVRYFQDCRQVLDVASGQGLLLEALGEIGISAQGVDNEPDLVADCRRRGLQVTEDTVFHFLTTTEDRFDGAYCGHLIEHLPYEALVDLVEGFRRILKPQGILLLRWPNPRSAITQHYTFWQDPTHVRFYDGDFLRVLLEHYGFQITETHYNTVTPQTYHAAPAGETTPTAVSLPDAGRGRHLKRLAGSTLRALKSVGQRIPAARRLSSAAEGLYTKRQTATMSRLIFKLPPEAYILARRTG